MPVVFVIDYGNCGVVLIWYDAGMEWLGEGRPRMQ